MTDLSARVVAAMQAVRTSEPHDVDCNSLKRGFATARSLYGMPLWLACNCPWAARVDARLAACVEAGIEAARDETLAVFGFNTNLLAVAGKPERPIARVAKAGLAAFLAAAAQKEPI